MGHITKNIWKTLGAPPAKEKWGTPLGEGRCGRCQQHAPLLDSRRIFSGNFGGWDEITPQPNSTFRGICLACAHCYDHPSLRYAIIIATPTHVSIDVQPSQARATLQAPLTAIGLSVPVGGKRACAPRIAYGRIATDNASLTWTPDDARRLAVAEWYVGRGYGPNNLLNPDTPLDIAWVGRLPEEDVAQAVESYDSLSSVRDSVVLRGAYAKLLRADKPETT